MTKEPLRVNGVGNDGPAAQPSTPPVSRRSVKANDLFRDCALVEIIHLHDCLRGAVTALQRDVAELSRILQQEVQSSSSSTSSSSSSTTGLIGGTVADDRGTPHAAMATTTTTAKSFPSASSPHPAAVPDRITDLECRIAGRFNVIWTVFRAHSAAEDEFIWPALRGKQAFQDQQVQMRLSPESTSPPPSVDSGTFLVGPPAAAVEVEADFGADSRCVVVQEEYEEDHADEERMFQMVDALLVQLRKGLSEQRRLKKESLDSSSVAEVAEVADKGSAMSPGLAVAAAEAYGGIVTPPLSSAAPWEKEDLKPPAALIPVANGSNNVSDQPSTHVCEMARKIDEVTSQLSRHLMAHLDKEEKQCMPLVMKHLTKSEIHDLVGQIMGKRSSDLMSQILTMAMQNLKKADRDEMVRYMKQAMVGTFFERWLSMGGWMADCESPCCEEGESANAKVSVAAKDKQAREITIDESKPSSVCALTDDSCPFDGKSTRRAEDQDEDSLGVNAADSNTAAYLHTKSLCTSCSPVGHCLNSAKSALRNSSDAAFATATALGQTTASSTTTTKELEQLIRAIASNPALTAVQKNTTIQGLRDSVWKSQNHRVADEEEGSGNSKRKREDDADESGPALRIHRGSSATVIRCRRVTPPSAYYKRTEDNRTELVWTR